MTENAIGQNLFAQVDTEGNRHGIFNEIVDHPTDDTEINHQDGFRTNRTWTRWLRETTKRWDILVQWKNQSTTRIALKDIKNSLPVQLAEYGV